VDENPDNRDKDKEVRKLIDDLIVEHHFAKIELYQSFITETFLIVRFLPRNSWRTGCIPFKNVNLGIIMNLILWKRS
jgi:hypothetical protein